MLRVKKKKKITNSSPKYTGATRFRGAEKEQIRSMRNKFCKLSS